MTAGTELKEARERSGLSAEQVSERTKIQLFKVKALEDADYSQLPQGIYLDGIVRAYAHEVGMDPEPILARVRRERGTLPGDWKVPFAEPIELHVPSPQQGERSRLDDLLILDHASDDALGGFSSESDLTAAAAARRAQIAFMPGEPFRIAPPSSAAQLEGRAHLRRSATLLFIALVGVGLGIYVSRSYLRNTAGASATYEASSVTSPVGHTQKPPEAMVSAVPSDTSGSPDPPASSSSTRSAATGPGTHRPLKPLSWKAPIHAERIVPPGSSLDVTGSWRMATHVESSSYARFAGLQLGYDLTLDQDGARVTGSGRKVTENGSGISRRAQTPVTVIGTIEGDRLTLNFVERGTRRPTRGNFVLMVDDGGILRGRFSSEAANSSGRAEAHRVTTQ